MRVICTLVLPHLSHAANADAAIPESPEAKLDWRQSAQDLFVGYALKNMMTGEYSDPIHFLIRGGQTRYGAKTRSQSLAQFNYDSLRLHYDRFYGLREELEKKLGYTDFDSFMHLQVTITPPPATIDALPLSDLLLISTPYALDRCFKEIGENDAIHNVVIDLTCNGGDMVLTLPYLSARFTSDPTLWEHDTTMGVTHEYHYSVDLNHNGIYGDEGDTYANKYNFFVLTSDFSFSCGVLCPRWRITQA